MEYKKRYLCSFPEMICQTHRITKGIYFPFTFVSSGFIAVSHWPIRFCSLLIKALAYGSRAIHFPAVDYPQNKLYNSASSFINGRYGQTCEWNPKPHCMNIAVIKCIRYTACFLNSTVVSKYSENSFQTSMLFGIFYLSLVLHYIFYSLL